MIRPIEDALQLKTITDGQVNLGRLSAIFFSKYTEFVGFASKSPPMSLRAKTVRVFRGKKFLIIKS
ncbi:MAG: hypothetical protein K8S87_12065 [Planctomycetes bacterium]|nr:hypothetical protein [Planctomycetota bacterium]